VRHRGVHVDRVPKNDDVHDEAKGAELVILALAIFLPDPATLTVEYRSGKRMAPLLTVQLIQDATPIVRVVDVGDGVERLRNSAKVSNDASEVRWSVASKERSNYFRGACDFHLKGPCGMVYNFRKWA
jgi:hypothetical protein